MTADILKDRELQAWLEAATRGLNDASCQRIGDEVRAHYMEVLEEVRSQGMDESDSRAAALHALGDPHESREGYRQAHLTQKQQEAIDESAEPKWSWLDIVIFPVLLYVVGVFLMSGQTSFFTLIFLSFLLELMIKKVLISRSTGLARPKYLKLLLVPRILYGFCIASLMLGALPWTLLIIPFLAPTLLVALALPTLERWLTPSVEQQED